MREMSMEKNINIIENDLNFKDLITQETEQIKKLLIDKNRKYGNSALEPKRVFSKSSAKEQILVRIDDKLSRIANQQIDEDEDVIDDLIGYLFLLKIAMRLNNDKI